MIKVYKILNNYKNEPYLYVDQKLDEDNEDMSIEDTIFVLNQYLCMDELRECYFYSKNIVTLGTRYMVLTKWLKNAATSDSLDTFIQMM